MNLGEATWEGLEVLTERVVVVPLGSLEQHGHHLPLLTDTMICAELVRRAEAELPDTLFLPPLWLGASDHHSAFPGTVSVGNSVYTEMLTDVLESLVGAGFRRVLVLNAHGGNELPGHAALYEVQRRHREQRDLWLVFASWMTLAGERIAGYRDLVQRRVIHACELETSMVLALRPELVRLDEAVGTRTAFPSAFYRSDYGDPSRVTTLRPFDHHSLTGAFGYPEAGTADKGETLFRMAAEEIVALVREFSTWPVLEAQ